MKFDVVTGNPPYQEEIEGTSATQIYPYFMDMAYSLSDLVCLVTPAKFLMNAGKTSKDWNEKMLKDEHLRIVEYNKKSSVFFPNTAINGGVAITLRNKNIKVSPIRFFYPYEEMPRIIEKVKNKDFESIQKIFFPQTKWDLEKLYSRFPNAKEFIGSKGNEKRLTSSIFTDMNEFPLFHESSNEIENPILIYAKGGSKKFIDEYFLDSNNNIRGYKAIISAADGASGNIGDDSVRITGKPFLGIKNSGYNQTFISFGNFKDQSEAEALVKYLKTKFVRLLVGTLKATNGTKFDVWQNVPLLNFKEEKNIDWSKSIPEIDKQLYKKYGFNQSEIDFIENHIQAME